jgi:hypothetical protein
VRVEIMPLSVTSLLRVYKYDRDKKQFNRLIGGIGKLSENDIFFSALNGDIVHDNNGDSIFVVLTKPTIETIPSYNDKPVMQYYDMKVMSNNICIDTILHAKYNHNINIMPADIPKLFKDCDFTRPDKKIFKSRKSMFDLRQRSSRKSKMMIDTIIESVDVFIKRR